MVSIPLRGKVNCDGIYAEDEAKKIIVSIPLRGKVNCDVIINK